VNTPQSGTVRLSFSQFGLLARLLTAVAILAVETLLISGLIQSPLLDSLTGAARVTHDIQHWLFRFAIAYAASFAILLFLRGSGTIASTLAAPADAPVRVSWLALHLALLAPFALLSAQLYRGGDAPFALLALGWHACGLAAVAALFAGLAPLRVWGAAIRRTRSLPLYALLPAAGAMLAYKLSQMLWAPASALTFQIVQFLVHPLVPSLHTDVATLTLFTSHFSVQVSEECSGLEGVGLMLAFCGAWLWYFRREYIFPRALLIVPVAVLLIFLLNSIRIAALVLIGDAGYQKIAAVGFHSQAGWIAFNLGAFAVAYVAKRSRWLNRTLVEPAAAAAAVTDATAAYLMPLLAILAAGMLIHALSSGFDFLYPLRIVCAVAALWAFRNSYGGLDWGFSWRGVLTGIAVFGVWAAVAHFATTPAVAPAELAQLPGAQRAAWIACRAAAAIITVPIAEELAFRGYLMRRLVRADFESLSLSSVPWTAVLISAIVFGITHGRLWIAGIIAGLGFGALAVRTGKIGESVAAHATTNALIAMQVLLFGQWQLW
jgi:exosortase E/protease (VPEID-CTERM system)